MSSKEKVKCVLCKKTIKRFSKWNDGVKRRVHRSCWLNFRDFGDRYADVLFCPDKKNAKVTICKPVPIVEFNDSTNQSDAPNQ